MKLVDKIKDYFNSKSVVDDSENVKVLYQTIMNE